MIAEVIVDISNSEVDRIFDYACGDKTIQTGFRVLVPFGNRKIEGYVIGLKESSDLSADKLKEIDSTLDDIPVIGEEMMQLAAYMKKRYHLRMVDALRLFIPAQMRGGRIKELKRKLISVADAFKETPADTFIPKRALAQREVFDFVLAQGEVPLTDLNKEFSAAAVRNLIERGVFVSKEYVARRTPYAGRIDTGKSVTLTPTQESVVNEVKNASGTVLLHGVTGSGKTEVYMRCIASALEKGKTAIMLEPEISLTPQVLKNFRARFGERVAILHSGLSAGERFDEWQRLLCGEARVAVGARSAIFAPLINVGIIIIDEEHDASYVSDSNPRYSTLEVASFR
ncbi:MAG: DEAD/DEAH box helicase, partial [Clostridiales bacterium]|nr:DEAD/DEAH box helicase [Clostridiales bacterium]